MYAYYFEAKSIQQYLFQSGKLKDVISTSERLDRLIDDAPMSVLSQVLGQLPFAHDLIEQSPEPDAVYFLRYKGGALYCVSQSQANLQQLRSLWTLTVQQLFPGLSFIDALVDGNDFNAATQAASAQLKINRQQLQVNFPYAEAIHSRYSRTSLAAVPISAMAARAQTKQEEAKDQFLDLDVEQHRQAYQHFELRDNAALQDRFTPKALKGKVFYPIDFEKQFDFTTSEDKQAKALKRNQKEAVKDLALIHIDGNGLGKLLMALRDALAGKIDREYCQSFRAFSSALTTATIEAAQTATQWLYDFVCQEGQVNYTEASESAPARLILPMRPIVLGGDDITLFCRADLALDYARTFCAAFEKASQAALAELFAGVLKGSSLPPYLTASGGVLFHKASHPFMQCHHLVEALCAEAKKLTKSVDQGGAALAFYRITNASNEDLAGLIAQQSIGAEEWRFGRHSYFVDGQQPNFASLEAMVKLANQQPSPMPINRWRQMLTALSFGDLTEAEQIYHRGLALDDSPIRLEQLQQCHQQLLGAMTPTAPHWFVIDQQGKHHSYIQDLLTFNHYQAVAAEQAASEDNA